MQQITKTAPTSKGMVANLSCIFLNIFRIPLHWASRGGYYEIVVELLKVNGNQTVNDQSEDGM